MNTRTIKMRDGSILEIEMSDVFKIKVANHFLVNPSDVTDEHLTRYIVNAVDNALTKAETNDGRPAEGSNPTHPA